MRRQADGKVRRSREEWEQIFERFRQEIRNLVAAKMLSFRATLSDSPANARTAVESLLDGERLAVYADPDKGSASRECCFWSLKRRCPGKLKRFPGHP